MKNLKQNENPVDKMVNHFTKACMNETQGKLTGMMEIYKDYTESAENPVVHFKTSLIKEAFEIMNTSDINQNCIEFRDRDVYVNLGLVKAYLLHADSYTYELLSEGFELMSEIATTNKVGILLLKKYEERIEKIKNPIEAHPELAIALGKSVHKILKTTIAPISKAKDSLQSFINEASSKDINSEESLKRAKTLIEVISAIEEIDIAALTKDIVLTDMLNSKPKIGSKKHIVPLESVAEILRGNINPN